MSPKETQVRNITTKNIQDRLISNKESSRNKIGRIKSVLNLAFDYAAENNVSFKAIKERVGHDQGSKTTESIYTHVTDKMKTNITDVLNDFRL